MCGEDVGSRMCVTRSFVDVVAQLLMAGMGVGGGVGGMKDYDDECSRQVASKVKAGERFTTMRQTSSFPSS